MTLRVPSAARAAADAQAQAALRAAHEFKARHGHRNALLDKRYELAERVMDAFDEYDAADELVRLDDLLENAPEATPRTPDRGDHHVYLAARA